MKELLLIFVPLAGAALAALWPERPHPAVAAAGRRRRAHRAGVLAAVCIRRSCPRRVAGLRSRWRARCCRRCRCCSSPVRCTPSPTCGCGTSGPNRVFVALLLAMLGLLSAGHQARHLGLLWIATEAVTLAGGAAAALQRHAARLRSDLEIPARRRHGHRAVAARFVLSGLRLAARRRQRRPDLRRALGAGGRAVATVGADRVGAAARRLRHEDGTRADAHVEARCLRRSAGHRRRAARGRRDDGGVSCALCACAPWSRRRAGARDRTARCWPSDCFRCWWRRCSCSARATSNACSRIRASSTWASSASARRLGGAGVWAALFHVWSNSLTKGALFPERRQHPARRRRAHHGRGARHGDAHAEVGADFCRGHVRRHRVSAVRAVLQRTAGRARGVRIRAHQGGGDLSRLPAVRVLRPDARGLRHRGRTPAHRSAKTGNRVRETAGVIVPPLVLLGFSLWLGLATPAVLRDAWTAAVAQLFPAP